MSRPRFIAKTQQRDFFRAVVEKLLIRQSSEEEIAGLIGNNDEFSYGRALQRALDSDEFETSVLPRLAMKTMARDLQGRVDLSACTFISLGTHCATSWLLKSLGLKTFSAPFDWIFSNVNMVCHALADDFGLFLDDREYVSIARKREGIHSYGYGTLKSYRDLYGMDIIFNHHDLIIKNDRQYFERCSSRLVKTMSDPSHKIFLIITSSDSDPVVQFSHLHHILGVKANKFSLIFINCQIKAVADFSNPVEYTKDFGSGLLLTLKATQPLGPLSFPILRDQVLLVDAVTRGIGEVLSSASRRMYSADAGGLVKSTACVVCAGEQSG